MADKNIFVLDDGTKELEIRNPFGEVIERIHVRTGDLSIMDRYNSFVDNFDKVVEPISKMQIKDDGTSDIDEEWKVIKQVEKSLIDKLNEVFDSKDIGNLFKKRNALSTINGEFYIEKVIDMLGKVIAQDIKAETEKSAKRLKKYTEDVENK